MAKQIKGNKIIEDDALANHIKELKQVLALNKKIDEQLVKSAKTRKQVSAKGGGAKGIKDLTKALTESEIAKKASLKIDQERANLEVKLKALNSEKIKENDILKRQVQDQTKANKAFAEGQRKLVGTEEKLLATNKKLREERKKLNTDTKKGARRLKEINKQLDKNNAKLEKNADRLKKQKIGIGRYSKAIGGLRSGLAQLGLAFGVFALIKDSFNVIKNFDQAQADLASVLGVTTDQMGKLTEQAKELGATTKFTATEVAELQKEYAKLGFTQEEIEKVTEATLQLAAAAGTELANAAAITGSTLRAFGLDSSETQRVVDVMAKSFSASSLDIEKFKTAMAAVAPVAKTFGFSVEETTALIGTLTDQGIDASSAGTGLRNMFLDSKKAGLTFQEALDKINNSSDKAATSFELFGKRGATLGIILAENQAVTAGLTSTLEDADGAAKKMADTQLNTLGGAIDLLKSAWEGLILRLNEGSGAGEFLRKVIKFLAENLIQILSIVVKVAAVFGVYKIAIKTATLANKLFGDGLKKNVKSLGIYAAVIAAVALAALDVFNSLTKATKITERLGKVTGTVNELLAVETDKMKLLGKELLATNPLSKEREEIINRINAEYGTTLQNLADETEFVKQLGEAYEKVVTQLRDKILLQVVEEELAQAAKDLREIQREIDALGFLDILNPIKLKSLKDQKEALQGLITSLTSEFIELDRQRTKSDAEGTENRSKEIEEIKKLTGKVITEEQRKLNRLKALRDQQLKDRQEFENEMIKAGVDRELINLRLSEQRVEQFRVEQQLIIDLQFKSDKIQIDARNKQLKFIESINEEITKSDIKRIEAPLDEFVKQQSAFELAAAKVNETLKKEREQRLEELKKMREDSLKIFKEITDGLAENIDKRIEERRREIDESTTEISRLQDLAAQGNIDAAESIKAERVAVAREKLEIEALEKKKRSLLVTVRTLERVGQLIDQGDNNPFGTAGAEMKDLLSGLKNLSEGTDYNIGQTLGKPQRSGTDGHLAWVDKKEKLLSIKNSEKLGGMHQDEVTRRALAYNNDAVSARAISVSEYKAMTDTNIVNKLDNVEQAIKNMDFPTSIYDPDTGIETHRHGSKLTRYHHKPTSLMI